VLREFNNSSSHCVIVISLKVKSIHLSHTRPEIERDLLHFCLQAGGVGLVFLYHSRHDRTSDLEHDYLNSRLNLTRANNVFLCDVWWNEAAEQQARGELVFSTFDNRSANAPWVLCGTGYRLSTGIA
jgi:hypothetical protein